jgi:hypothetical protein
MAGTAYETCYKSHRRARTDRLFNIAVSINIRFVCATPVLMMTTTMMMMVVVVMMTTTTLMIMDQ